MKIALAVDPYNTSPSSLRQSAELAEKIRRQMHQDEPVEPVYAMGAYTYQMPAEFAPMPVAMPWKELKSAAEVAYSRLVKKAKVLAAPLRVVKSQGLSSAASDIKGLDRYLRQQKAPVVIVSSQGRSGLRRVLLGSFAESAMRSLRTPLLIVNPKVKISPRGIKKLVFATDGSLESQNAFLRLLEFSKHLKARIELVSVLPTAVPPQEALSRELHTWVETARSQGVAARSRILWSDKPLARAVADFAKGRADAIALATVNKASALLVLTGLANQLVRLSPLPLLVLRS